MASGIIQFTTNKTLMGRILWESESMGTQENASEVTCNLQVKKTDNTTEATTGTWSGSLTVGGETQSFSIHKAIDSTTWVSLCAFCVTVPHSDNGDGACYIYGKITGPTETTLSGVSVSGNHTVSLDTIPRFASIRTAPNFTDEENPTITYSNPAGTAVTDLRAWICLEDATDPVVQREDISKTGTSYTFNLTEAERDALRGATTGSNSRTVRFYVRSEIGSAYENSGLPGTFSIADPHPTIHPTVTDSNAATVALTGNSSKLVKYYSNASVAIGAAAVKKAELVSKKVTCGAKSRSSDGTIAKVESKTFLFAAKDSRGNITSVQYDAPFVEYVKLTCNVGESKPTTSGTMTLKVTGNCFTGSFGAVSNALTVKYRYKASGGSYKDWVTMSATPNGASYTATAELSGLDYKKAYTFQACVEDKLATVYSAEKTVMAMPVYDWGASDFAFHVPVYDQFGARMGNGLATYTGSGDSGIDPNTTLEELCLTSHQNAPQGAGTSYYIQTAFYNTKSTTAARAQLAIPYKDAGPIYHRYTTGGAWSSWSAYLPANETMRISGTNDVNTTITPGLYTMGASSVNLPNGDARWKYGALLVLKRDKYIFQTVTEGAYTGNFVQMVRYSEDNGSTWKEWSWVNPPMDLGTEYRTTELFAKKAVYTKLVDLGTLPNAVTKTVAHNASVTRLLRVSGVTSTGTTIPYRSGASFGTITANKNNVVVYYSFDASVDTGTAQIWYTKD